MSSERTILAFDLGTSGVKAAVVSTRGAIVDREVMPLSVQLTPDGGAEQHPHDWWRAMAAAAHRIWGRGVAKASSVAGIGLSSQWGGTVAVGADGAVLRPAMIWMDSRGAVDVARIAGGFPSIDGYGVTKVLKWIRITGGAPSLSGKDPVGHIAWLRRQEPKTWESARYLLEPKDWVNYRLTGRAAASFDSIAVHWATDNRHINAVKYDDGLLRLCEMEKEKLPELIPAASVVGTLTAQSAEELGLSTDVQVVSGAGDMHMAAIGAGTVGDFQAHLCLGTSSWLLSHVPFQKTDLAHNMGALPSAIPGRYLFCNEQESAGVGLKLLVEQWFGASSPEAFSSALNAAAESEAGARGLLYLPWLHGERSPVDDRHVRGGFVGLGVDHGRGDAVRAVLEGVALNGRWLLKYLEPNVGRTLDSVAVVGGGARSELWCQIHADVFGRQIRQVDEPQMANARGAAMQAAVGLGLLGWDQVTSCVPVRRVYEPNPQRKALYDDRFEQFQLEFKHRRAMGRRFGAARSSR